MLVGRVKAIELLFAAGQVQPVELILRCVARGLFKLLAGGLEAAQRAQSPPFLPGALGAPGSSASWRGNRA